MTLRYLLDTNELSEAAAPAPNAGVVKLLHTHQLHLATASVVWNELLSGCQRLPQSRRRDKLQGYIDEALRPVLTVLPYDTAAAEWHAAERARLQRTGTPSPFVDGQIAAIAHVHDLVLVTANVRDFRWFHGVTVEDWRS